MSTIVDHQIKDLSLNNQLIFPFQEEQLNPASYDVRLGAKILVEGREIGPTVTRERWKQVEITANEYWLDPGEFVLAVTEEVLKIPVEMEAVFQLKSSRGREGYEHALAGYIDPGFHGKITLELSNLNRYHKIPLTYGMLIGQIRFLKLDAVPSKSYSETGNYYGDMTVQPSKSIQDFSQPFEPKPVYMTTHA